MDKYIIVTDEEFPKCVKSFIKEPQAILLEELKSIRAVNMVSPLRALKNAFNVLNLLRLQNNADFYAQGLYPGAVENAIIIFFNSGCWPMENVRIQPSPRHSYICLDGRSFKN